MIWDINTTKIGIFFEKVARSNAKKSFCRQMFPFLCHLVLSRHRIGLPKLGNALPPREKTTEECKMHSHFVGVIHHFII